MLWVFHVNGAQGRLGRESVGRGQSRTYMYLLRTAHLGEVSVSVWPDALKKICMEKNIKVFE